MLYLQYLSKNKRKKIHVIIKSYNKIFDWDNYDKINGSSWGACMDSAVDQLYDDWVDDPLGTFSCWVTGPLCVIGGGIACAIQTM